MQLALGNELRVLPVLNKIDLPGADVDATAQEIESTLELDCTEAIPNPHPHPNPDPNLSRTRR